MEISSGRQKTHNEPRSGFIPLKCTLESQFKSKSLFELRTSSSTMSPSTRFKPAAAKVENKGNHFNNLAAKDTFIDRFTHWRTFINLKNVQILPAIHVIICDIWWRNTNACENAAKVPQCENVPPRNHLPNNFAVGCQGRGFKDEWVYFYRLIIPSMKEISYQAKGCTTQKQEE